MDSMRRRCINKRLKPNPEGQDFISNLPDFIIGLILSLLPTKDAFRTSVLSKRWINLWMFITAVEIKDKEQLSRKKIRKIPFYKFVNKVLLHLESSSIQSFSLSLSQSYRHCRVDKWINDILINLRVKELYINSKQNLSISCHTLLESPSLEVLMLNMNWYSITLPTFVCLSSLTVLKFSKITVTCDPFKSQMLTLNFPVLREYLTEDCNWSNVKGVTLEVPLLEVLSIKYSRFPISKESNTVIKFCAPCLAKFYYYGLLLPDTNSLDLSIGHIAYAHIDICPFIYMGSAEQMALIACELLKKFNNNVECLTFQWPEGIYQFDEELSNPDNVPSCFMSNLQVVNFGALNGKKHELRLAKFIMDNAKELQRVSFSAARNMHRSKFEKVKKKIISFKKSVSVAVIDFLPLHN
ncbi:Putative FBD-associated F-box protein [Glycine soja]|uniref:Putative FBD-associated F-box protein n=1 Tax=Glycine soja TaxID=3848 RepID=A0A0B2QXL4_GLYSO|nr:Putative FBD-associated F-box protein [Glycine soja]